MLCFAPINRWEQRPRSIDGIYERNLKRRVVRFKRGLALRGQKYFWATRSSDEKILDIVAIP